MTFFDSHVHFYPDYDLGRLLSSFDDAAKNFAPGNASLAMAVMLRSFQPSLRETLSKASPGDWSLEHLADGAVSATRGERRIFLLPARQVAAIERVEALGLFGEEPVPDGLPLGETISLLRERGYAPVLAWGFGKWLFSRAKVVNRALDHARRSGRMLLIGDSALRPVFWPEPRQYHVARRCRMRVIHGSDPLPRKGDECRAGSYASLIDADINQEAPTKSLLSAILDTSVDIHPAGERLVFPKL